MNIYYQPLLPIEVIYKDNNGKIITCSYDELPDDIYEKDKIIMHYIDGNSCEKIVIDLINDTIFIKSNE